MKGKHRALAAVLPAVSLLIAACGTQGGQSPAEEPPKTTLIMGFVPSGDASQIITNAQPIADYLTRETGIQIKAQVTTSYSVVVEGMTSGTVDIGWIGALGYVLVHDKSGAEAMTKSDRCPPSSLQAAPLPSPCPLKPSYPAIIIARANSNINAITDLRGKKVGFGDPESTSSNLWPKYYLKQNGINPDRDITAASQPGQSAIAAAVYNGTIDAGAMFGDARLNVRNRFPDILTKTKVIFIAPQEIPGDPQVIRKKLNSGQKAKVKAAFAKMGSNPDPAIKTALSKLYNIDAIEPAKDSDYDPVRKVVNEVNPGVLTRLLETPSPTPSPTPTKSP